MNEYIFDMGDALYDEDTRKAVFKPKLVGELVRCKDCKYWAGKNGERITIPVHENCYSFTADDYCSYGERGEENGN